MLDQVSQRYYRPGSEIELASLTRYEKVYTKVVESSGEGAADVAGDIADEIGRCVREKGRCVIGMGTGKAALDVYDELVKLYFADKLSFAGVIVFNIGELELGAIDKTEERSTFNRLRRHLFNKVDIDPANVHTFSSSATNENVHSLCKAYENEISEYGGLDILICQLTKNGSLAYNEPGSSMNSSCRLMLLGSDTRTRVAEAFQCETAPRTAVTLGMSNLLAARRIICVAWGEDSAKAVFDTIEGPMVGQVPASFLQMHHNVKLVVDLEAASMLTRINYPWQVTSCEWTDYLIRRAIVWLCRKTGKPILKLTNKDYNDNGLGELALLFGSAYNVNIRIFNEVQHTITGWPGGKPNADDSSRPERATPYPKRVLAFSPHPNDVVVSMGGTLRRLVEQGHEVHVVFQTDGDIAVGDEDVMRHILLNERLLQRYGQPNDDQTAMYRTMRNALASKVPGDADIPAVRFFKGQILACESLLALDSMGVKTENVHELHLPFHTDEPFGLGKVTAADVQGIKGIIERVKPHQIFVSDDLTDPNGTHERATSAVLMAVEELQAEPYMRDCRVWMYRGQWSQWNVDRVEMAVPMSPEEFRDKSDAVLKFRSQVHDASFRDNADGILSWERSLKNNRTLADDYIKLGLASYEAIEAFVKYNPKKD